ncbi:hypothetical protein FH063_003254 [Azospirillum argentinense]|uniref:Uncharacterized protein n=1 Tax=Azospirillum argentinense TaxID=2970906 RepID=A0A5B0KNR8_9PROT|nr:hypothetical protein FH063_003254 [Azospirillum argentinense]
MCIAKDEPSFGRVGVDYFENEEATVKLHLCILTKQAYLHS